MKRNKAGNSTSTNGVSRRDFLKTGALSSLALGGGVFLKGCSPSARNGANLRGTAKNVIFMVSDGMSMGTLTMADQMKRLRDGKASNWIRLYEEKRVNRGFMDMTSLDSIVTDSAAAAASWGCGHRVNNGSLNIGPNGEIYRTILETYRDAGKATGLVTTTEITHATPAGFAVNVPSRSMGEEIADQYLDREYDLLLGGGNRHFSAEHRSDNKDLYTEFASKGYNIVRKKDELTNLQNNNDKLLGIFANSHLPYTTDHLSISDLTRDVPTLADMSSVALNRLSKNSNGFLLQIEGGRVDHAAHANDVSGLLFDQLAFDDALGEVLKFIEGRDDTLLVITSDHGNANPGLNGHNNPNERFESIINFKHTNNWILSELDESSTVSQVRDRIEEATKLQIRRSEAEALISSLKGTYETLYQPRNRSTAVLGTLLANYTGVNFIGTMHTSDYVELASMGPGSQVLSNFTLNTELFDLMVEVAGVEEFVAVNN